MSRVVLEVENLAVEFPTEEGMLRVVDGVSFALPAGEVTGLVGESGCGKSVTALALMGLIPAAGGRIAAGRVLFDGQDLARMEESRLRRLRGKRLAMVFQEPMSALNPVRTIGRQLSEVLVRHAGLSRRQARAAAADWLGRVGLPRAGERLDDYPHQLSGGMRQRVMVAMALACKPDVLIADEPTTALDVTTQAQVLEQLISLGLESGAAICLITHDLGVVAETCSQALVMYCGRLAERAPVEALFRAPRHPYTRALLEAVPRIRARRLPRLPAIAGAVPDPQDWPAGCRFAPRCPRADAECRAAQPPLGQLGNSRVACFHPEPGA